MSNLLGGNSSQNQNSASQNLAYPGAVSSLGSTAGGTSDLSSLLSSLLSGGTAGSQGLQSFQNSSGFQNQLDTGSRAVTDNAASRGLLQSGATGQALTSYGNNLAQQSYNNYLSQVLGAGNQGISAQNAITAAGQVSNTNGSSSSKQGLGL